MDFLPSENARKRMMTLAKVYADNEGNYREQGPNNWSHHWADHVPRNWGLPQQLTRRAVLEQVEFLRREPTDEAAEKVFLSIMVWGFGDTGYGPYRVGVMKSSRPEGLGKYLLGVVDSVDDGSISSYAHILKDNPTKLGPVYATKVAYFMTPGEISPILDSAVVQWVYRHQRKWLFNCNTWSVDQYAKYLSYCQELLNEVGGEVPEDQRTLGLVEYLMFIDQAAAGLPKWAKKI